MFPIAHRDVFRVSACIINFNDKAMTDAANRDANIANMDAYPLFCIPVVVKDVSSSFV